MDNDWDETIAISCTIEPEIAPGRACLVVVRGRNIGEIYPIVGPDMVIGRATGADLRLDDEGVSRFHCKLRHVAGGIVIEDLNSRNGTLCNGDRVVPGMRALVEGDRLQVGTTTVLRFTYEDTDTVVPVDPDDPGTTRDPLTWTYTRRHFIDRLQNEVGHALRQGTPLSLLLIHIDRFTEFCTKHGQTFGDKVVIAVAEHVLANIRAEDMLANFSGGEFGMMSHSASPGDTFMFAERLRKSSAGLSISPAADVQERISLTIAVAAVHELRIESAKDLLIAAGTGLHRGTSQGGDRVVLCTQDLLREPKNGTRV